jgi:two-component system LytT family response regulator
LQAVDYLLKPFDRERLQQALKRAQDHLRARPPIAPARGPERVAVRANGRIVFLKPSEVVWVEAANNYCTLHLADASQLTIRVKLSAIEQRLGHANFARVNRSAVVHLEQVKELQLVEHGDYVVVLRNGLRLPLSRQLRGSLQKLAADAGSAAGPGFAPAG